MNHKSIVDKFGQTKMRKSFLLLFLILYATSAYSQLNFIPLQVDHALFRGSEGNVYLEAYVAFFQKSLTYAPVDGKYQARYIAIMEVMKGDSTIARDIKERTSTVDSLAEITATHQFVNTFAFEIAPGTYRAKLLVRDAKSKKFGQFVFDFHAQSFPRDQLRLSDIQLAHNISSANVECEFDKNSYRVLPNPATIYNIKMPVLYYYLEVYNMDYHPEQVGEYQLSCRVNDLSGQTVREFPVKTRKKPGSSAVIVGGYNVVTLPGATYQLQVRVTDRETGQSATAQKMFRFVKPGKQPLAQQGVSALPGKPDISEYAAKSEDEMDLEFKQATYLETDTEKKVYYRLNVDGKRTFLAKFWKRHNPFPDRPAHLFKNDYFRRVEYANINFSTRQKRGWETDRGRVLLMYGTPDEVDRHYMDIDKKPYEIWYLHSLEGGVMFVFADLNGFGDFELVHSTYSRELNQPGWERLINRTRSGGFDFQNGP